jgi:hypothetical protein
MADEAAILFGPGGKPTHLHLARWRAKSPAIPLRPEAQLVNPQGFGTDTFYRLWTAAFPTRSPLPPGQLAESSGRATKAYLDAFA